MKTQSLSGEWQFQQSGTDKWLNATVPGGAHTDLLALGMIPDPFIGTAELDVQWVGESDWCYRKTFTADDLLNHDQLFLVCDGLDTIATVSLNGQQLGETDNMFRQYRWDVKALLQARENTLEVTFKSPVETVNRLQAVRPMQNVDRAIPGAPHMRKSPSQFGWDWGPILPPIGIWRDLRLEAHNDARISDVHLRQQHEDGVVTVSAVLSAEQWSDTPLSAKLQLITPDGDTLTTTELIVDGRATLKLSVENPQLWYPNRYGEQPLYTATVTLTAEQRCDEKSYKLGLRTIELRQEPDEWGRSFTFVVNGIPVFAKGGNWIPADSFPTRIGRAELSHLLGSAADAHHNMIRVWGGGIYEDERFYDLCDELGLLVWQDFMFSCATYPLDDPDFVANLKVEAEENMRRIRHRACLALWCGNNEMEEAWTDWGWRDPEMTPAEREVLEGMVGRFPKLRPFLSPDKSNKSLPDWQLVQESYDRYFHHTLPAWVAALDPDTPYWQSSPSSDTPFLNANGEEQGDAHYWGVWHARKPFTAYRKIFPRFMSEFGFQALPTLETVKAYAAEPDRNLTSYVMEHHQRGNHGNGLILAQMTETFQIPTRFDEMVYLSLVLQAEGIRYGVEHWRRNMDRVSGTLYWQLNDCWPVASWASIDYFGRWKALHYASKRFFAPLLLSVEDVDKTMSVHVSSDLREAWHGELKWSLETVTGEQLQSGQQTITAPPLKSNCIHTFEFEDDVTQANERDVVFVCSLWAGNEMVSQTVTPFVQNKHLALKEPNLRVNSEVDGEIVTVSVSAETLARFVELKIEGVDVVFSDNYFDVPAGKTIVVQCPNQTNLDPNSVMIHSLYSEN